MDRILEVIGWVLVAAVGFVFWIILPESRTIIACLLTATLIYHVFFVAVKLAVGRVLRDQLLDLRADIDLIAERLEHIDRKANVLLLDSRAHRQAASLRDAAFASVRRTLMHQQSA